MNQNNAILELADTALGGAVVSNEEIVPESAALQELDALNAEAEQRWKDKLKVDGSLTRSLVSFQANKSRAIYRWYKYKEAFSAGLVEVLLGKHTNGKGLLLDPFAGSGTAMFAAGTQGMEAEGIELLPIGQTIIGTKQIIDWELERADVEAISVWAATAPWKDSTECRQLHELRITKGAYPPDTVISIGKYLASGERESKRVQAVLQFALLCILETISYTRKDGQYLRWDHRSGRRQGKKVFNKGPILNFEMAIRDKLQQIVEDLKTSELPEGLFSGVRRPTEVRLHRGSCLDLLPKLKAEAYDCVVTSPPYCNRYDYTRTYALELALLGVTEDELVGFRQAMLSCTVENRAKDLLAINPAWQNAITAADQQQLLQKILAYLENQKELDLLNNDGIPRMVRGYFYEMACVIAECARVLKRDAPLIMVNDNVRYAGACVPVDIILSEMAEQLGFRVEDILVLPNGKGNSSQQMGAHGRDQLRKCVYIWRKN